jgi:hypothetical protein
MIRALRGQTTMMKQSVPGWALAVACVLAFGVVAVSGCIRGESESVVAVADLPAAVKDTAQRVVPGIVLTKAEKETKCDKVVYEVKGQVGNKGYEIEVAEDGTLIKAKIERHHNGDEASKDGKKGDK